MKMEQGDGQEYENPWMGYQTNENQRWTQGMASNVGMVAPPMNNGAFASGYVGGWGAPQQQGNYLPQGSYVPSYPSWVPPATYVPPAPQYGQQPYGYGYANYGCPPASQMVPQQVYVPPAGQGTQPVENTENQGNYAGNKYSQDQNFVPNRSYGNDPQAQPTHNSGKQGFTGAQKAQNGNNANGFERAQGHGVRHHPYH